MKTNLVAVYHHPALQPLHEAVGKQDHRTLIFWALDTGIEVLDIFTRFCPDDPRPALALAAADAWSKGEIKMPAARRAAKETHQAAKDTLKIPAATAAAHAMGQIIGVVHVATHAPAYAAYAVQASVLLNQHNQETGRRLNQNQTSEPNQDLDQVQNAAMLEAIEHLLLRLSYWAEASKDERPWASFLK
jgi:hypothetical protein